MARFAIRTELALMLVILGVARKALAGQLQLLRRAGVADFAFGGRVFTGQRELGHGIVVKVGQFPRSTGVATRAILPIAALVGIVLNVTAKAGNWWFDLLGRLLVAGLTCDRAVRTFQCKTCHLVVIKTGLGPAAWIVTTGAIRPVLALVGIVTGMAGIAIARRMFVDIARPVAPGTRSAGVAADQRKACA